MSHARYRDFDLVLEVRVLGTALFPRIRAMICFSEIGLANYLMTTRGTMEIRSSNYLVTTTF